MIAMTRTRRALVADVRTAAAATSAVSRGAALQGAARTSSATVVLRATGEVCPQAGIAGSTVLMPVLVPGAAVVRVPGDVRAFAAFGDLRPAAPQLRIDGTNSTHDQYGKTPHHSGTRASRPPV